MEPQKRDTSTPGELVQIDHLTVNLGAATQFKAICPTTKQGVLRAYSTATALNAKQFLEVLINDLPFPLISIQVDGDSEFIAEFENACQSMNIPLYVLPPKRPQYNGCVERANSTSRSRQILPVLRWAPDACRDQQITDGIPKALQRLPDAPGTGSDDAKRAPSPSTSCLPRLICTGPAQRVDLLES